VLVPFHAEVDTVFLGKLGLLACLTEHCQPLRIGLNLTACLSAEIRPAQVQSVCSPSCLGRPHEVISAPTKGEAAVWSCAVLAWTVMEERLGMVKSPVSVCSSRYGNC